MPGQPIMFLAYGALPKNCRPTVPEWKYKFPHFHRVWNESKQLLYQNAIQHEVLTQLPIDIFDNEYCIVLYFHFIDGNMVDWTEMQWNM